MSDGMDFEATEERPSGELPQDFVLDLEGYEGPIDVLLQLARDQKVDITRLSILALAEQYLEFVRQVRKLHLELAADYLVMAAWLAYLKSKLLLPEPEDEEDEPSGAEMAAALRFQLQRLEAMQRLGQELVRRPRLHRDFFARGEPETVKVVTSATFTDTLYDLLKAYAANENRGHHEALLIPSAELYSVDDALHRLESLMGETPGWRTLVTFLPADLRDGVVWRSAVAATLAASLEMCRSGKVKIRQDSPFGPIFLRNNKESP